MRRVARALAGLCFVLPVIASQQFYISQVVPQIPNPNGSGTVPAPANRISSSGVVSGAYSPVIETCPTGVTPDWPPEVPSWAPYNVTLAANPPCFLVDQNSVGDQLVLAGDAFLVSHTGAVTNLTQTYRIEMATGINTAGDIVGWTNWDTTQSGYILPQPDGGGCNIPPGFPSNCHSVGVLLRAGTSTLVDLNTVLSPNHATVENSTQGLIWYPEAINDSGQISVMSLSAGIAPWGVFVLTPCSGSCPADAY